ncbi:MAG: hypothetical protein JNN30_02105 [Rhodanobacteraceae bacterium]|nr:hypothetical protein [Rhodanobacteraceae bacterium]
MNTIRDADLILYYYGDGLSSAERAEIEQALAGSAALGARYQLLLATLRAVDAQSAPEADGGFEQRLWLRWEEQVSAAPAARGHRSEAGRASARERHRGRVPGLRRYAGAALALVAALGIGFLIGRQPHDAQPPVGTSPTAALARRDLATRALGAYVAAHLRETEGVVLTAVNSDNAALLEGNRELAASLLESNRLYAQAAVRAGNPRLADFLRQLEPLLLDLANPASVDPIQGSDGLRDYVDKTDLLFQLRAIQARMESQRATSI